MSWLAWTPDDGDRTLPPWARALLLGTGLLRLSFGLTLIVRPEAVGAVWPWTMTPLTARLLGASTLVSVPLAVLPAAYNRYSVARIPIVMMLTYRVLQFVAGLLHIDRFDFGTLPAWNYFVGGGFMLAAMAFLLVRGPRLGAATTTLPRRMPHDGPLHIGALGRAVMDTAGVVFMALAVVYMALAAAAAPVWVEAPGRLTPLTARLFGSPMTGLALGLWLIARAQRWREGFVPAIGMATFGLGGSITLVLGRDAAQAVTPASWAVLLAPAILLGIGAYLLLPARRAAPARVSDTGSRV